MAEPLLPPSPAVIDAEKYLKDVFSGGETPQSRAFNRAITQPALKQAARAGLGTSTAVPAVVTQALAPFQMQAIQQLLTMRQQQAGEAATAQGLELQGRAQGLAEQVGLGKLSIEQAAQALAEERTRGELGLQSRAQALAEEVGRGGLEIERGGLGLRERAQALAEELGRSDVDLRTRAQALAEELGRGGFGLQARAQTLAEEVGRSDVGLRTRAQGLAEVLGLGQLGLSERENLLGELVALGSPLEDIIAAGGVPGGGEAGLNLMRFLLTQGVTEEELTRQRIQDVANLAELLRDIPEANIAGLTGLATNLLLAPFGQAGGLGGSQQTSTTSGGTGAAFGELAGTLIPEFFKLLQTNQTSG